MTKRMVILEQEQEQVLNDLERNYLLLMKVQGDDSHAVKARVEYRQNLRDLLVCTRELKMEQLPATERLVTKVELYFALNP